MDYPLFKLTLEKAGVVFKSGLSLQEIHKIEDHYRFRFPPDYRDFLMFAMPVNKGFYNWRYSNESGIPEWLSWLREGILFDIEANAFWMPEWGERPEKLEEAFSIAKDAVDQAPVLIPIRGHRYIPAEPEEEGNPIFSVHQTDIIYYGHDLGEYLVNEFGYYFGKYNYYHVTYPVKQIRFWSRLVDLNEGPV